MVWQYLPQHEGLLPWWLLLVSVTACGNTFQAFTSLYPTRRVYPGSSTSSPPNVSPVTPLQARTFGVWTLLSAAVRLYAAYYIDNPQVYELTLFTYVLAWGHFLSEWLVFGSTSLGAGLMGPLVVSNVSLVWMVMQWRFYVE